MSRELAWKEYWWVDYHSWILSCSVEKRDVFLCASKDCLEFIFFLFYFIGDGLLECETKCTLQYHCIHVNYRIFIISCRSRLIFGLTGGS